MKSITVIEIEKEERFSKLGAEECTDIIRSCLLNEESCREVERRLQAYKDKLSYCTDYKDLYADSNHLQLWYHPPVEGYSWLPPQVKLSFQSS